MITQIPNCMNGARTLKIHQDGAAPALHRSTSTTGDIRSCMGRNKYYRGQLASFSRLAYPCNQANEKKKNKKKGIGKSEF